MTNPTTTAQVTVLSEPVATPSETGFTVTLSAETWDRHIKHYRVLTEQVRVLRGALSESEFAMNAVKNDVPWHVKDECMFDEALHIARRALAALEGEVGNG